MKVIKAGLFIFLLIVITLFISLNKAFSQPKKINMQIDKRVDSVLALMTIDEKIGQLVQFSNFYVQTGTGDNAESANNFDQMIRDGKIGSFLNTTGVEETRRLQKLAVEQSRMKIPLIFGFDVIHGYHTIFPVPLAETASFDRQAMEKSARVAAVEAASEGLHWTFAPMIDVSRDPRWGRIMEGAGEDIFLNQEAAIARVKGFQGDDLTRENTIAACAKHFVAYGAPVGGRDYNAADISERTLREVYLPPFKAAIEAGTATFMSSFNTLNGVPATGSRWLLTDILRNEWNYDGFVVSDWNSIGEMLAHGSVENPYDAAYRGFNAGVDMDMQGALYLNHMKKLIIEGKITNEQLNNSVRRILKVKFQLGLFDNPFQYCNKQREKAMNRPENHLKAARDVAKRSVVLLKNQNEILPLSKNIKSVAVIGPLADDKDSPLGNWRAKGITNSAVSLLEGIKNAVSEKTTINYAEGCKLILNESCDFFTELEINETDRSGFDAAVDAAQKSDVVIMALGETAYMSGECRSYADISLKGLQKELLMEIKKTEKPIILTLFNGRPLVLTDIVPHTDAILECWLLGSESGNAIADVLFGDYNPSGKLPASFPYHVGQVPVFYEQLNTGRPYIPDGDADFSSIYRDIPNDPLFPFGFGLSYTTFKYSNLSLSTHEITQNQSLKISLTLTNNGKYAGQEVVQLYIRDIVGKGVSRPLKQLKGFKKIYLEKAESQQVEFEIYPNDLAFFRLDKKFAPEAGFFDVYIGSASNDIRLKDKFELITE